MKVFWPRSWRRIAFAKPIIQLRPTAQDGTGKSSLFIGSGERMPAPDVPRPNVYQVMGMSSMHDLVFFFGEVNALSDMTERFVAVENNRNAFTAVWHVRWAKVDGTDYEVNLTSVRYLNSSPMYSLERSSQSIPLTTRLSILGASDYDTGSELDSSAGLEYILDKRFRLIGQ